MFTGLIREIGTVTWCVRIGAGGSGLRYRVDCPGIVTLLEPGASIAVNGVCQTVYALSGSGFEAEAVASTMQKSTIGMLKPNQNVNLEPALRVGDPLGGHILQGHVQTTGRLLSLRSKGRTRILCVETPSGPGTGIISEGSVGIDGISLTVSLCLADRFEVNIIPETWESTTLKYRKIGDLLNIEGDLLLRGLETAPVLSRDRLEAWGY